MPRKLPETLTEEEVVEIIKATNKEHHRLAFTFGFYQGMRIGEIINLQPENINWNQRLILIKQGKGNKDRNIPILKESYNIIRKKRRLIPLKCGIRALEIAFKNSLKRVGIERNLHFHHLRHSCATWLLNVKKWDTRYVQQFLGHADLGTTQIYTHVSPQNLVDLAWK